ncbi:MAG: hypothetical protein A2X61_14195 [Ignavibacteria bacterium GWB2_35_12]|nr:MAG: hypothetical protein A2X63_10445 [Ignavibacteria bacterium GWA2_35_8]OGU41255.1 MAG: hypothetical protein A2X61_14195 [Ignavibacteria bacterium GWB2_35_12]OGU93289.1 MAG: hypothetical protein A2220_15030 [Ignavibacteria bacterium RIFOXYA2_FULL_35_10]OGV23179.1 MAG: hypothetical protein A2475_17525 [Ignavibacteria bacterium RIFOXYC2_FULL_35_21]
MSKTKIINLTDLQINTENYRFEPVASQKEAIDKMIFDQGNKLFNLAEHIVMNGLNPNDKIQVVNSNHDKTKYNVLEGNRRSVSLKLLNNPDLIDQSGHASLKNKFRKLNDDNKSAIIKDIECTVYDSPAEADKWIKLKHAGQLDGAGTVTWNAQQVDRFEEKIEGKSSVVLQTIKMLEKSADIPNEIKNELPKLKISNLERLLSDPQVRDFLGVEINSGIIQSEVEEKEVIKGLTQVAKHLLDPSFNVQKIYTKVDREDYLKNFPKESKPNIKKKSKKPWQFNGSSSQTKKPKPKLKPNPKDRDTLIPKNCLMIIKNPKVNSIYYELQKLPLSKFVNVAAISFRVFIENSMDCFIEENKITTTKDGKPLNKESRLINKITEVANYLETNKLADKHTCKGIRSAANNHNDLLGIETLHAYVHNAKFSAIATHLVTSWDNIQSFTEKVWENIK